MTSLLDTLFALVLVGVLNLWIMSRLRSGFSAAEGPFLARVYGWTLVLRFVGALFLNMYATSSQFAQAFWGDSSTYDDGGWLIALVWRGEIFGSSLMSGSVSGYGFHYFVGLLYFVFGRNQLLIQLLNGTIGSLAVVVIFALARSLFGSGPARWAALFMAFFPQMIFWSCAMYKDPSILLCIAVSMYAALRLRLRFTSGMLVLFITAIIYLMTLRFYVFYMVAFATVGTFLLAQRRGLLGGLIAQVALLGVFLGVLFFGVRRETIEQQTSYFDLDKLQTARSGQATLGKSAFGAEIDVSKPAGALSAVPVGLVYLLFAPFPWAITGLRQLLTLPETLVWYALMPALLRGFMHAVRHRLRDCLPIVVFAVTLTLAYAVFQSNVGTAYRQRTQVSMFFFIFMGVGIEQRRAQKEGRARAAYAMPSRVQPRPAWPR